MTVTVAPTAATSTSTTGRRSHPLLQATVVSGLIAAAATTALAAVAHAVGVALAVDGEQIPALGFAQMTFVGAVLGGLIVAVLNRWSGHARRRFVAVAAALVVAVVHPVGRAAARRGHQARRSSPPTWSPPPSSSPSSPAAPRR